MYTRLKKNGKLNIRSNMETVHIPGFWFLIHISNINNVYNHNAVGKRKPATLALVTCRLSVREVSGSSLEHNESY